MFVVRISNAVQLRNPFTATIIEWWSAREVLRTRLFGPFERAILTRADLVLVMEQKHRSRLMGEFPDFARHLPLYILVIPDDYGCMDEELIPWIRNAADPIIEDFLA